jgi:hypothetical protein
MSNTQSTQTQALKDRRNAPAGSDLDPSVNLQRLLDKNQPGDWPETKAGVIEGFVQRIAKKNDGDYHIVIASAANEPDRNKEMIVEVTPYWQNSVEVFSEDKLKQLTGKRVRVTGWLFYDPNEEHQRGTRWELHPVTDITVVG